MNKRIDEKKERRVPSETRMVGAKNRRMYECRKDEWSGDLGIG